MSLVVETIQMHNFRNFEEKNLILSPQTTILHGRNAVGKTNTIEALHLLTTGKSFRHPKPKELIQQGAEQAIIKGTIKGDGRLIDISLLIQENTKHFTINNKKRRSSDISGTLISVLFCPDDLLFIKGSARGRRDEIDNYGAQISKTYQKIVQTYTKTVEQRNHLLKEEYVDFNVLDAWDESLAIGAGTLLTHRFSLFLKLKEAFLTVAQELVPAKNIDLVYKNCLETEIDDLSKAELIGLFNEYIKTGRSKDILRRQTTIGPHRDDIIFLLDGQDARDFGSQGQQRALVLSWKIAQLHLAEKISGSPALLLLDDVMSELDDIRRSSVLSHLNNKVQTVISTTNLGYFSGDELREAQVIEYEG